MRRLILPAALLGLAGCKEAPAPASPAATPPSVVQTEAPRAPASAPASAPRAALASVAVEVTLDADAEDQMRTLTAAIRGAGLERKALRDRAHAAPFLALAARSADPQVIASALEGMAASHVRKPREGREERGVDAAYAAVVKARLTAADAGVRVAAIHATRLLIGGREGQPAWIDAVVARLAAAPTVAERIELLKVLHAVRDFQLDKAQPGPIKGQVTDAVLKIAEGAPGPVRTAALDLLSRVSYPAAPHRARSAALADRLIADPDPAVRGTALALAARLAGPEGVARLAPKLMAGLRDPHPFVRGAAAAGVARVGYRPGAHTLVTLLEDRTLTDLPVGGWTDADGAPATFKVRTGLGHDLASTSFRALLALAGKAMVVEPPADRTAAGMAAARVAAARAWYAANKASLGK